MKADNSLTVIDGTIWDMFDELDEKQRQAFRLAARNYFNPKKDKILSIWHPVFQDECLRMKNRIK